MDSFTTGLTGVGSLSRKLAAGQACSKLGCGSGVRLSHRENAPVLGSSMYRQEGAWGFWERDKVPGGEGVLWGVGWMRGNRL